MRLSRLALATVVVIAASAAQAPGLRSIDVPADASGPALAGEVWSPCAAPATDVSVGNVMLLGVNDCPIAGDKLPLIVFSHGRRGSLRGHHDTAEALADAGFLVAAINHPGDNSSDASQTDDLSVLIERPADIKRLTDDRKVNPVAGVSEHRQHRAGTSHSGTRSPILAWRTDARRRLKPRPREEP